MSCPEVLKHGVESLGHHSAHFAAPVFESSAGAHGALMHPEELVSGEDLPAEVATCPRLDLDLLASIPLRQMPVQLVIQMQVAEKLRVVLKKK